MVQQRRKRRFLANLEVVREAARDLSKICDELTILEDEWELKLDASPSIIRDDVLVFQKTGILSQISSAANGLLPTDSGVSEPITPKQGSGGLQLCLCTTSSTSSNGTMVGVLSIFCSVEFEMFWRDPTGNPLDQTKAEPGWQKSKRRTFCARAETFNQGWIGKYELWSADSKRRTREH